MSEPKRLLEVARIGKAHGLRGDVTLQQISNRPERFAVGAFLFDEAGNEFRVAASREANYGFVVRFAHVSDRNGAEALRGTLLFGEELDDDDALWAHKLIGSVVRDQDGIDRGKVVALIDNPASDLLELESGSLVPLTFVTGRSEGIIEVTVPPGLFHDA